jgi:hypothetical protein
MNPNPKMFQYDLIRASQTRLDQLDLSRELALINLKGEHLNSKMKFVIFAPYSDPLCGGLNVLCTLAKKLSEKGYDTKIWSHADFSEYTLFPNYTDQIGFDEDTIVVYPEMILGNPIPAKRIVRWVLFGAHLYDQYQPDEMIYYFDPFCQNHFPKKVLQCFNIPPDLCLPTEPRTEESCFVLKKGYKSAWVRDNFYANHPTGFDLSLLRQNSEIIEVLKKTKYFHCYDPASFVIVMALLCGCIVIKHPYIEGQTREQWEHSVGFGYIGKVKGLAYGDEDLSYAESTIHEAPEYIKKLFEFADKTLDSFIEDMETGNFTNEPCYRFNESPYSYQHCFR